MKNLFKVIALLIVAILATGCATTGAGHDTITGTVAGGLIGGAVAGNKGARIGALLGAGIGVLSDSASRKDNERAEKIDSLIYSKTGSGNDSGATQAAATAESNLAFAEQQRRKCEAKYAVYQKNGVRVPHDCEAEFRQALADADYAAEANSPEVFHETMRSGGYSTGGCSAAYLRRNGINPNSANAEKWCYRLKYQGYDKSRYPQYHRHSGKYRLY